MWRPGSRVGPNRSLNFHLQGPPLEVPPPSTGPSLLKVPSCSEEGPQSRTTSNPGACSGDFTLKAETPNYTWAGSNLRVRPGGSPFLSSFPLPASVSPLTKKSELIWTSWREKFPLKLSVTRHLPEEDFVAQFFETLYVSESPKERPCWCAWETHKTALSEDMYSSLVNLVYLERLLYSTLSIWNVLCQRSLFIPISL